MRADRLPNITSLYSASQVCYSGQNTQNAPKYTQGFPLPPPHCSTWIEISSPIKSPTLKGLVQASPLLNTSMIPTAKSDLSAFPSNSSRLPEATVRVTRDNECERPSCTQMGKHGED